MKIYYGNGNCSIEGATEGMFMIMTYNGAIEITDLTPDGYAITTRSNKIAIFPYQGATLVLGELFSYVGTFKIVNAEVADINGKGKPKIYKVMDYSELLDIAAEDMTTVSEDLNAGDTYVKKMTATVLKQTIIPNLHTHANTLLYLPDDTLYSGAYHIHLVTNIPMTGETHTSQSVLLKTKKVRKKRRQRPVGDNFVSSKAVRRKSKGADLSDKGNY